MVEKGVITKLDKKLNNFKEAIALIRKMKHTNDLNLFDVGSNSKKLIIAKKQHRLNSKSTQNFNSSNPKFYTSQHIENKFSHKFKEEERVIKYSLLTSSENSPDKIKSLTFPKIINNPDREAVSHKDPQIKSLNEKGMNYQRKVKIYDSHVEYNLRKDSESFIKDNRKVGILTDLFNEYKGMTKCSNINQVKLNPYLTPSNNTKMLTENSCLRKSDISQVKNKVKIKSLSELKYLKNSLVINNSNKALDTAQLLEVDNLINSNMISLVKPKKNRIIKAEKCTQLSSKTNDFSERRFASDEYFKLPDIKDLSPWVIYENED